MPRLMSDEEAARAAAITAMGYRLAAAGPRIRQRLRDRQPWPEASWPDETQHDANADWPEETAPAAFTWRDMATALRRSTLLASAAACGFGLVLIGLNMSLEHRANRHASRVAAADIAPSMEEIATAAVPPPEAAQAVTRLSDPSALSFTASAPPPPIRESMSGVILPPPGAIEYVTTLSNPPHLSFAALQPQPAVPAPSPLPQAAPAQQRYQPPPVRLAAREPEQAVRPAPAVAKSRPKIIDHRAFAATHPHSHNETLAALAVEPMTMPSFHARSPRPELRSARLVMARADRPAHAAEFDVPRWLAAEKAAAPPRVLIMSPPPHMLTHPAETGPTPAEQPAPVAAQIAANASPPPVRRLPPLVVASSGYPDPAAATPPAYRPYYYQPQYPSPYNAPYYPQSYGGYYGNAPQ